MSKKVDASLKAEAKRLYFQGFTVSQIVEETGISDYTLRRWINGSVTEGCHWKFERQQYYENAIKEAATQVDIQKIASIVDGSLDILLEHLSNIKGAAETLEIKDLKFINDIVHSLDRILSRELGKPTQTIRVEHTKSHAQLIEETKQELQELMEADELIDDDGSGEDSKATFVN